MSNNNNLAENTERKNTLNSEKYKLSVHEFFKKRRESKRPLVFDLRSPDEYAAGHIYNSYSLPISHFEYAIYQLPYNENLLFYGGDPREIVKVIEILEENSFDNFFFVDSYQEILQYINTSMIEITSVAQEKIREKLEKSTNIQGIRIVVEPKSPLKAIYSMEFVNKENQSSKDLFVELNGIKVFINSDFLAFFEDTILDYNNGDFEVSNKTMEVTPLEGSVKDKLELLIEEQINPSLSSHGGSVSLVEIKDGNAYVVLGGGCQGCAMAKITMKQGVEAVIKENIPEIIAVHDITDHSKTGACAY